MVAAETVQAGGHGTGRKGQRRAVAASPQDPSLKLARARYLIQDGKITEAREQLNALVRLGDNYVAQAEVSTLLKSF
jgi:predicted Zn-dependent protease